MTKTISKHSMIFREEFHIKICLDKSSYFSSFKNTVFNKNSLFKNVSKSSGGILSVTNIHTNRCTILCLISDDIDYQPHKQHLPTRKNRPKGRFFEKDALSKLRKFPKMLSFTGLFSLADSVHRSICPSVCVSVDHTLDRTLPDGLETCGQRAYR